MLSPTLFLTFINDIADAARGCDIALFADDVGLWPKNAMNRESELGKLQLKNGLDGLTEWASDWRMVWNVKKSGVVLFRAANRDRKAQRSVASSEKKARRRVDIAPINFILSRQQLPVQTSARYLGVVFDQHGHWDSHFDSILPKVRYAVHRICRIIRRDHPPCMPIISELIKTHVHPIISYGFPIVRFTQTQQNKLDSLLILPIKRSLSVFTTTSHAALFINSRLLDVESLWLKSALSFTHRLHKLRSNPAAQLLQEELNEWDQNLLPSTTPEYTRSFASRVRETERKLHLHADEHMTSRQLKEAAAMHMIKKMQKENSHAPFLINFDLNEDHLTRPDHHLRADPPSLIALRSRLRLNSSLLNSTMCKRKLLLNENCDSCKTPETLQHVILHCPRYDTARSTLFATLGFKPPDDYLLLICLGRTPDRKLRGHRPTLFEHASGLFLSDIARIRPNL